ncbi:hypothetical protein [Mycobacterium sp. E2989]|uniref:5-methylcytosine restriction system specificity protein McrC n=1 Tax=Mycobacterium sp. E2989 TaxID=1834140 RepID=UPI0009ED201D
MTVDKRISLREWAASEVTAAEADDIRATFARLKGELRPTLELASIIGTNVTVQNLIGSTRLQSGAVIEVEPKIPVGTSWAESIVQLIGDETRIAVVGSQRSTQGPRRNDLSTAIAFEYARRLESALRQDGPIQVYEHHDLISRRLNGRLKLSKWVRSNFLNPALFPIERDEFSVANDFARGLSLVSGLFLRSALNGQLASRLRALETAVIPGQALPAFVNPAVALRHLPAQWAKYQPAWDIAAAVLRNRSVVGDPGHASGLEVALEPWPLLETLLSRSLRALVKFKAPEGYQLAPKTRWPLLTKHGSVVQRVEPDGLLLRDGTAAVTFEAKYAESGDTPRRAHSFQALATAAALHSPLAVIVYPDDAPIRFFDVAGFNGRPKRLATVGLSMFTYRRRGGAEDRAHRLEQLLNDH